MKDYPWFKNYPKGIPREINPDEYPSLLEMVEESLQKHGDRVAYENMGGTLTFDQVDQLSNQFAVFIQNETSLKQGDRLAIQMPNLLQYPIALFGGLKCGLTIVNVNPLYTPPEMLHQLNDSGSKAILILANFASNLQKILPETQLETVIVTEIGDLFGSVKRILTNFVVRRIKKMVPPYSLPQALGFNRVLSQGKGRDYSRPELTPSDIAFLQYTGGTTGVSKGATLSHRNVCSNVLQARSWFFNFEEEGEIVVTALPLYHIFALTANCLFAFFMGAKNVLITNPRDIPEFIKELNKHKYTLITGVNTLFNGLMNNPEFKKLDFENLKITVGGGMAVQKAVAERWEEITGCPIAEGYGLSETSPMLTVNPLDGTQRIGSIGLPVPNTEIQIMNEEGQALAIGEVGEICARGPQVFQGYWQRPEETEGAFFEDWFRTGDIGVMDTDGFVKIVDRKKDMILVSGFNVYPNEIEDCVAMHPGVLEVAAIGVADAKSTEAVKIFIVRKDQNLTEEELKEHCRKNLTPYKVPKHIEFRNDLPKTNVGKILRRALKEEERLND